MQCARKRQNRREARWRCVKLGQSERGIELPGYRVSGERKERGKGGRSDGDGQRRGGAGAWVQAVAWGERAAMRGCVPVRVRVDGWLTTGWLRARVDVGVCLSRVGSAGRASLLRPPPSGQPANSQRMLRVGVQKGGFFASSPFRLFPFPPPLPLPLLPLTALSFPSRLALAMPPPHKNNAEISSPDQALVDIITLRQCKERYTDITECDSLLQTLQSGLNAPSFEGE
ncbi:hypothetical protein L1887_48957 [Cichorium endivia]|nr:hypothetical protein L1887_48957 [Cichorium endivia]